jgi:hypothetical protein
MGDQIGAKALVVGVGGVTLSGGIVSSSADALFQSLNLTRNADINWIKDENGDTISGRVTNKRKEGTIQVVPCGTVIGTPASGTVTGTGAAGSVQSWLVAAGTIATVVDSATGAFGGTFIITQTQLGRTPDGAAVVDVTITNFDVNNVAQAVAAS